MLRFNNSCTRPDSPFERLNAVDRTEFAKAADRTHLYNENSREHVRGVTLKTSWQRLARN